MAPGNIYMKCEEPDMTELNDSTPEKESKGAGSSLLQCFRCYSDKTSISVLYIANGVLLLLWIITIIVLSVKYSKMAKDLEQLHDGQRLLIANDTRMKKQLDTLQSSQSSYVSQMNNSMNRLGDEQTTLKKNVDQKLGDLIHHKGLIWDEMFRVQDILYKLNDSVCKMCPDGWLLNRGQCYYFNENPKHWSGAKKDCEDKASLLVSINDPAEQAFLQATKKTADYWIGLHDMKNENTFVWLDNSPLTYTNWNLGEPNNYGTGEDCGMIQKDGYWNDLGCGETLFGSICEKPWKCQ
ncbi:CD209 antigen-like protein C [Paroedura picta]|uniref:CD209 antigen-like protein C n=1 Tax=Paroedura picta TaxID=143630 RepID=UPI0040577EB2